MEKFNPIERLPVGSPLQGANTRFLLVGTALQPAAGEINPTFNLRKGEKAFTLYNGGVMSNLKARQQPRAGSEAPKTAAISAYHFYGNHRIVSTFSNNPSENFLIQQTYSNYPTSSRSRRSPLAQSGLRLQRRSIGTSAGFCLSDEAEGLHFFPYGGSAFFNGRHYLVNYSFPASGGVR